MNAEFAKNAEHKSECILGDLGALGVPLLASIG